MLDSENSFEAYPLSQSTKMGLKCANYEIPTEIQKITFKHTLRGGDVIGTAKTGSGKTLALLIPVCYLTFLFIDRELEKNTDLLSQI